MHADKRMPICSSQCDLFHVLMCGIMSCAYVQCEICFEREVNTRLQPCGHMMCQVCFQSVRKSAIYLTQSGVSCPFCRSIVKSSSQIATNLPMQTAVASHGAGTGWVSTDPCQNTAHAQSHAAPMRQDGMNFGEISDGEHQWFCDVAAQVARAELEAARMAGGFEGAFNGRYAEPHSHFDLYVQGQAQEALQLKAMHTQHLPETHACHVQSLSQSLQQQGPPGFVQGGMDWDHQYQQHRMQWMGGRHDTSPESAAGMLLAQQTCAPGPMPECGLGGVQYLNMNLPAINSGGRQSWMDGLGGVEDPDMFLAGDKLEELARHAQCDEDGASHILKMMFGVAME